MFVEFMKLTWSGSSLAKEEAYRFGPTDFTSIVAEDGPLQVLAMTQNRPLPENPPSIENLPLLENGAKLCISPKDFWEDWMVSRLKIVAKATQVWPQVDDSGYEGGDVGVNPDHPDLDDEYYNFQFKDYTKDKDIGN